MYQLNVLYIYNKHSVKSSAHLRSEDNLLSMLLMQEQWQTDRFTHKQILNCNLHTDSTDLFKRISSKESFIHKSDTSIASHIEYIFGQNNRDFLILILISYKML